MAKLYDIAQVLRSKNAGPLLITIDVLFAERATYDRVVASEVLTPGLVAELYGLEPSTVDIVTFDAALAIKVTYPRTGPTSGSPGDRDVLGAQQHGPISNVDVPCGTHTAEDQPERARPID